jgi:hypothetical protein
MPCWAIWKTGFTAYNENIGFLAMPRRWETRRLANGVEGFLNAFHYS